MDKFNIVFTFLAIALGAYFFLRKRTTKNKLPMEKTRTTAGTAKVIVELLLKCVAHATRVAGSVYAMHDMQGEKTFLQRGDVDDNTAIAIVVKVWDSLRRSGKISADFPRLCIVAVGDGRYEALKNDSFFRKLEKEHPRCFSLISEQDFQRKRNVCGSFLFCAPVAEATIEAITADSTKLLGLIQGGENDANGRGDRLSNLKKIFGQNMYSLSSKETHFSFTPETIAQNPPAKGSVSEIIAMFSKMWPIVQCFGLGGVCGNPGLLSILYGQGRVVFKDPETGVLINKTKDTNPALKPGHWSNYYKLVRGDKPGILDSRKLSELPSLTPDEFGAIMRSMRLPPNTVLSSLKPEQTNFVTSLQITKNFVDLSSLLVTDDHGAPRLGAQHELTPEVLGAAIRPHPLVNGFGRTHPSLKAGESAAQWDAALAVLGAYILKGEQAPPIAEFSDSIWKILVMSMDDLISLITK